MGSVETWTPDPTTGKPRYRARWRDPAGRSRSQVFATKRDARRHLAEVETSKAKGAYIDPARGRMTFEVYARDVWAPAQDWKASTRDKFEGFLGRVRDTIGVLPLDAIDRTTVLRCRSTLTERHAKGTVTVTVRQVKAILRAAAADGRIGRDPTVNVASAPKRRADDISGKVTPDDIPTAGEVQVLIRAAPAAWRAAVALGACGLRIGEVLAVRRESIDLERRRVTVDRQATYRRGQGATLTTPKAEKSRTIGLPSWAVLELRRHLRDHAGATLLFEHRGGLVAPTSAGYVFWDRTRRAAGLGYRFHALRHFCASSLLARGVPVTDVAFHLGDTVPTLSRTYAHFLRGREDIAAEVLDAIIDPGRDTPMTQTAEMQSDRP